MLDFSEHQIRYDNQREFDATNLPDNTEQEDELEEEVMRLMDSTDFPTFDELKAFGWSRKKYMELATMRAQSILDRKRYGFAS